MRTILSLFDFSGEWSRPYREAGYHVIMVDIKRGEDIRMIDVNELPPIHGILSAPPCTHFSGSGAQYWKQKDLDGRTFEGLSLVDACIRIIHVTKPTWWVLENPVGRLNKWLGKPAMYFQPYEFGDPYTKKTALWGNFNKSLEKNPVAPIRSCSQGSWIQMLGGKSERTKEARSVTPAGFAAAFFRANP